MEKEALEDRSSRIRRNIFGTSTEIFMGCIERKTQKIGNQLRMNVGSPRRASKGLTLIELLVAVATIGVLAGILFPIMKESSVASGKSSAKNLRKITLAAIHYGDDYDERIMIIANGAWRNLKNVRDGELTVYGDQRTDLWPLILLPYVKDR